MKTDKPKIIKIFNHANKFAENKDIAKKIREEIATLSLNKGNSIIYDYVGVESTTQSFTHALISEHIRTYGKNILDRLYFKNCNGTVKRIIELVVDYMQRRIK